MTRFLPTGAMSVMTHIGLRGYMPGQKQRAGRQRSGTSSDLLPVLLPTSPVGLSTRKQRSIVTCHHCDEQFKRPERGAASHLLPVSLPASPVGLIHILELHAEVCEA